MNNEFIKNEFIKNASDRLKAKYIYITEEEQDKYKDKYPSIIQSILALYTDVNKK
jgi:hypothetical protein